jgi:hypothetical protein
VAPLFSWMLRRLIEAWPVTAPHSGEASTLRGVVKGIVARAQRLRDGREQACQPERTEGSPKALASAKRPEARP